MKLESEQVKSGILTSTYTAFNNLILVIFHPEGETPDLSKNKDFLTV